MEQFKNGEFGVNGRLTSHRIVKVERRTLLLLQFYFHSSIFNISYCLPCQWLAKALVSNQPSAFFYFSPKKKIVRLFSHGPSQTAQIAQIIGSSKILIIFFCFGQYISGSDEQERKNLCPIQSKIQFCSYEEDFCQVLSPNS